MVSVSRRLSRFDVNMNLKVYIHLIDKKDEKLLSFIEEPSHDSSQKQDKTTKKPLFQGFLKHQGRLMGLEPMSAGATIQCVNQLHHSRRMCFKIIP